MMKPSMRPRIEMSSDRLLGPGRGTLLADVSGPRIVAHQSLSTAAPSDAPCVLVVEEEPRRDHFESRSLQGLDLPIVSGFEALIDRRQHARHREAPDVGVEEAGSMSEG